MRDLLTPVSGPVPVPPLVGEIWTCEIDDIEIIANPDNDIQVLTCKVVKVHKAPTLGTSFVGMTFTLLAEDIVLDYQKKAF